MSSDLKSVIAPEQLRRLTQPSDRKGLAQLALHAAALAMAGWLVALTSNSVWFVLALWVYGVVLVFLFAPLHESIHRTAFRSRWLNTLVASVCGFLLVLPPRYFRSFHLRHHRYTQDPERDPELTQPAAVNWRTYLWRVSGLPYWWERVGATIRHAQGRVDESFIDEKSRAAIVAEARSYLLAYGLVAVLSAFMQTPVVLWYWLLPAILGQPFLRLYLMAEHGGCPRVSDMLRNSRTTQSNALIRWLAWNMPYHAEHHRYAAIPFHALPEAHALLKRHIAVRPLTPAPDGFAFLGKRTRAF
jgi:fatty acid desaturase